MGRPPGRVREVTAARRRVLQVLADHESEWLSARTVHAKLAGEATSWVGGTYACIYDMEELGWLEVSRDEDTTRRPGVVGRRPRATYRITELGKTALIEALMGDET
jgi:DNA-binding PadR family transcriptional regulator